MKKKKEERGRVGERERREEWEGGGGGGRKQLVTGIVVMGKGPSFRDSILSQNVNFTSVLVKDFQL